MGNLYFKEKCPSEMTYDASEETCPSEMTYDASENCIAPCEKEDIEHSDVKDRFPALFVGAFPKLFRIHPKSNYNIHCENEKQETSNFMMSLIDRAMFDFRMFISRITWKDTPEFKALLKELGRGNERDERERIKFMIYMLLLAIFLGNDDKCKFLATPDRGKISCITVYLLGNDGAHSYNGNGIPLTKGIKYARFTDEELLDEIRPDLPLDVLRRQPTDKEIARLSRKIGKEYRRLAYELGITRVQLDHLTEDNRDTEYRIQKILFIWRDANGSNATFETLVNALVEVGINPGIVCQSLERA